MITEDEIRRSLAALDHALAVRGVRGEICLFGGAVMVLAFHARQSTKDVDAIFAPASIIRDLAAEIGRERGMDEDWLNDGVKGFVSARAAFVPLGLDLPNLTVLMPVPQYLLAMKCMSARTGESVRDLEDVKFLLRHLRLDGLDQVLSLVEAYYPAGQITVKTRYFAEAALEEIATECQEWLEDVPPNADDPPEDHARHSL